jgi:prepilin-type N-terminal cleavage/methylation domain-containing protein
MKKHGFTLTELVAVMAALAIVMGIAAMLLVQLLEFQQNTGVDADEMRSVNRLVAAFRSDVHTYGKPEMPTDEDTLLRWKTETETVEYTIKPGEFSEQQSVVRTVRKGDETDRIETYRLPDRTALHVADGKENDAGLLALSLWTAPQGTAMPKLDELNPFDRTLPKSLEQQVEPKYAGNWRTIIARY